MTTPFRRVVYDKLKWFFHEKLNFLQYHYLYIGALVFIFTGLWYCERNENWSFMDAFFMATTTVTNTGLNTVDMSRLANYHLILMMFGSILGSHILVSLCIVSVRKYYFSKRFEDVLLYNRARRLKEQNKQRFLKEYDKSRNNALKRTRTLPTHRLSRQYTTTSELPSYHTSSSTMQDTTEKDEAKKRKDIYDRINYIRSRQQDEGGGGDQDARSSTTSTHVPPTPVPSPQSSQRRSMSSGTMVDDGDRININSNLATSSGSHDDTSRRRPPPDIRFNEDVDYQREKARQQLKKYDKLLRWIAKPPNPSSFEETELATEAEEQEDEIAHILSQPIHKSQLSRKQRYHIGGVEYRAIDFLSKLVPFFYLFNIVVFGFALRIYIACSTYAQGVLKTSNPEPVNPWIFSFFTSVSAFNNLGLTPLSASLVPFQSAPAPLIFCSLLIIFGNTAYAIVLRGIIWSLYKVMPKHDTMQSETMRFLLDHPRRCYTNLFSSTQTWWLVFALVVINLVEMVVFLATNFWLPVLDGISWGARVLDAYFQGVAIRNAGFAVVNLEILNPGTQIVYIIAMYISVYPVAISIRNSNIFQERELGIYSDPIVKQSGDDDNIEPLLPTITSTSTRLRRLPTINSVVSTSRKLLPKSPSFYVKLQMQRQLAKEISWVIAGIFCVCVIESKGIMAQTPITVLSIMYECVSAFGTAGSSLGYPRLSTSQSANYHTLSKLMIILLMYRGRHRGLPSAIDHAVLLPSEQLDRRSAREHDLKEKHAEVNKAFGSSTGIDTPYYRHVHQQQISDRHTMA